MLRSFRGIATVGPVGPVGRPPHQLLREYHQVVTSLVSHIQVIHEKNDPLQIRDAESALAVPWLKRITEKGQAPNVVG